MLVFGLEEPLEKLIPANLTAAAEIAMLTVMTKFTFVSDCPELGDLIRRELRDAQH